MDGVLNVLEGGSEVHHCRCTTFYTCQGIPKATVLQVHIKSQPTFSRTKQSHILQENLQGSGQYCSLQILEPVRQ